MLQAARAERSLVATAVHKPLLICHSALKNKRSYHDQA
jgi:hypothetical protein